MKRFVEDLHEALANELALLLSEKVFVDYKRLEGGDFFNQALATALCRSACMILIYTPTYFDSMNTYCTREYKAMLGIEHRRFEALGNHNPTSGLIIPIVFRGWSQVPNEIKSQRQCHNFDSFLLYDENMSRHPSYAPTLRDIALYISQRCDELQAITDKPPACEEFMFPDEGSVLPWLSALRVRAQQFPGVGTTEP